MKYQQLERCLAHRKILNKYLMRLLLESVLLPYHLYWKPESDIIGVHSSFILPRLPSYSVYVTFEVAIELIFIKIWIRRIRHKARLLGVMTAAPVPFLSTMVNDVGDCTRLNSVPLKFMSIGNLKM